jgi:hypothetical protein
MFCRGLDWKRIQVLKHIGNAFTQIIGAAHLESSRFANKKNISSRGERSIVQSANYDRAMQNK